MPVLLEAKDFDGWLDGSLGPEALKPAPAEALREWKISPRLNRTGVGDDDPTIIEPLPSYPPPVFLPAPPATVFSCAFKGVASYTLSKPSPITLRGPRIGLNPVMG